MIFIRGDKLNEHQIEELYELHRSVYNYTEIFDVFKRELKEFYILYRNLNDKNILGYINVERKENTLNIKWIYGPGYGKLIIFNIENHFRKKNFKRLILEISINQLEKKDVVLKRFNFFIRNKYRTYDYIFKSEYNIILKLEKNI